MILPALVPALLTGFALALARAIGEYGSVIFIAGNIPYVSEIAPLLIVIRLEEFNYAAATAIATIMLAISFVMLLRHQPDPGLEATEVWPWRMISQRRICCRRGAGRLPRKAAAVRRLLIAAALCFVGLFLLLPLAIVFAEAFKAGIGAYFEAIRQPDTLAAIRLTLLVAAIAVPAQPRLRPCRRVGHRQVRVQGQELPDHAHRPAVLGVAGDFGPDLRAAVRAQGYFGPWLSGARRP